MRLLYVYMTLSLVLLACSAFSMEHRELLSPGIMSKEAFDAISSMNEAQRQNLLFECAQKGSNGKALTIGRCLLAEFGISANSRDIHGTALLHAAIGNKNQAVGGVFTELLLAHKANIETLNSVDRTPLRAAVLCKNVPVVRVLLKHNVDISCKQALVASTLNKHTAELEKILDRKIFLSMKRKHKDALSGIKEQDSLIWDIGSEAADLDILDALVKAKIDVDDTRGNKYFKGTLLLAAARYHHHDPLICGLRLSGKNQKPLIKRLLEYGADRFAVANRLFINELRESGADQYMADRKIRPVNFSIVREAYNELTERSLVITMIHSACAKNGLSRKLGHKIVKATIGLSVSSVKTGTGSKLAYDILNKIYNQKPFEHGDENKSKRDAPAYLLSKQTFNHLKRDAIQAFGQ